MFTSRDTITEVIWSYVSSSSGKDPHRKRKLHSVTLNQSGQIFIVLDQAVSVMSDFISTALCQWSGFSPSLLRLRINLNTHWIFLHWRNKTSPERLIAALWTLEETCFFFYWICQVWWWQSVCVCVLMMYYIMHPCGSTFQCCQY